MLTVGHLFLNPVLHSFWHLHGNDSCFVPGSVKQPTMTGRHWRHFCVEWPHMVAGLFGPASWDRPSATLNRYPASALGLASVSTPAPLSFDDSDSEDAESGRASFARRDGPVVLDPAYREQFGNVCVEDAVLCMFCQAAKLNGLLFGDNKANPEITTDAEADEMAKLANDLVNSIEVLLGSVISTKLHRLAHHLLKELRNRGNL